MEPIRRNDGDRAGELTMSHLKGLIARARSVFARNAAEARMDEEFEFHLEMEAKRRAERDGVSLEEGRRRALASFGGVDTQREAMRDGRGTRWFADSIADVRYALRAMRRSPGFAIAVAITLGLGIGVNGIIFGYVDALLFRPLPVSNPDRLVALYEVDTKTKIPSPVSFPDFLDYRDRSGLFNGLAGFTGTPINLSVPRTGASSSVSDMVWGELVTENYFTVLEMRPALGRLFTAMDAPMGANPFAVLSYESWKRRFNSDSSVIGSMVRVNGTGFTIVGVAARGFKGMRTFGFWPEIWVPVGMHNVVMPGSTRLLDSRDNSWVIAFGRLRAGANRLQTEAGAIRFASQLAAELPASNETTSAMLIPAAIGFDNPAFAKPSVLILASAMGMFAAVVTLLIICANLTNLQLARAATRTHEIAVRLSLGCSRGRLIRQLLVESAAVALPGVVLGMLLIWLGPISDSWFVPRLQFRVGFGSAVNLRVVAVTTLVSLGALLLFGLAPAVRASRSRSLSTLIGSRRTSAGAPRLLRSTLVVGQLALSVILLVGATLFVRSLMLARNTEFGFDPHHRAVVSVNVGLQNYDEARGRKFYDDVLARVRAMPEVANAAWGFPTPFDTYGRELTLYVDGARTNAKDGGIGVSMSLVGEDFVNTLGLRLRQGHDFTAADSLGAPLTMIVSKGTAERLWPGKDPIGQRARRNAPNGPEVIVSGVVDDATFAIIGETTSLRVYEPLRQHYRGWQTLIVHTRSDAAREIPKIRAAIAATDPALPSFGAGTLDDAVANGLSTSRSAATIAGFFGVLALLISSVGLYAVVASGVVERTREIGVRVALGSTPGEVMRLVMGSGARLGAIGLVIGMIGAVVVARLMAALLYGTSPGDRVTFELVPIVLIFVVMIATFIPARRAVKLDPVKALRAD
jgi:predicted permease